MRKVVDKVISILFGTALLVLAIGFAIFNINRFIDNHVFQIGSSVKPTALPTEIPTPTAMFTLIDPFEAIYLINEYRASKGLTPYKIDNYLCKTAQTKTDSMAESNYFSHEGPVTLKEMTMVDHQYYVVGENLAYGTKTPQELVKSWMDSPTHDKILLDQELTNACIASTLDEEKGIYVAMHLGAP